MRILGSAVITMESLLMGFAILLAMEKHGALALVIGGVISLALLLCAGLMKSMRGWYIGTFLQIAMIAYGVVVTPMYYMGALFAFLWGCAFYFGRKGEAIRAELLKKGPPPTNKPH
jgi:hypothetical protein